MRRTLERDIPPGIEVYMCGTGKSWSNELISEYWISRYGGVIICTEDNLCVIALEDT